MAKKNLKKNITTNRIKNIQQILDYKIYKNTKKTPFKTNSIKFEKNPTYILSHHYFKLLVF